MRGNLKNMFLTLKKKASAPHPPTRLTSAEIYLSLPGKDALRELF